MDQIYMEESLIFLAVFGENKNFGFSSRNPTLL